MSDFYIALGIGILCGIGVFVKCMCTTNSKRLRKL